jgi:hypothetical protein
MSALAGCAIEAASTDLPPNPTMEVTPDSVRVRVPPAAIIGPVSDPAIERGHVSLPRNPAIIREVPPAPTQGDLPHPDPSPDPGPR